MDAVRKAVWENYVLLLVIYDEAADQAVALHPFRNVVGHLADGTLRGAEGRFVLSWEIQE